MKQTILAVVLFATALVQQTFAQNSNEQTQLAQLLHHYYDIKNALVSGKASVASKSAEQFVTTLNGIDDKTINKTSRDALAEHATHISKTSEIKNQREHFAGLSTEMFSLAKTVKLTTEPIYYDYCPMKKTYWLSSEATIKNPYYGPAMPTCGKISETLK